MTQNNPPDYTEFDESRRTTFIPGSAAWHQAQDEMREHQSGADGDEFYVRDAADHIGQEPATGNFSDMFDALDRDTLPAHQEEYATEYPSANPELSDPRQRVYLVDGQKENNGSYTYANEYSRYLDHQAADEMEMPQFNQYGNEKNEDFSQFSNTQGQSFFDEDLDGQDARAGHEEDESSEEDDDDDDDEEENSPIEIVAATVSTFDDPTLPCLTFRFWLIGTFFTILGAGVSQLFYFRSNAVIFSVFFVQLMSYPMGVLMAMALPRHQFNLLGWRFSFNPGPFNMKEHMLIGVSANTGGTAAYAVDILAVQRLFYGQNLGALGSILLLLTTQCIGYGMAGFLRRFLVTPANMIWPSNLVQVALYNTLHGAEPSHRGMKRQTFFIIVFCVMFVYQILPFYMAPILSSMAILCWILPKNGVAQLLGSGMQGLGLLNISLDWSAVGSFGPLYTPWWAQLNFFVGVVLTLWVLAPALYFSNTWDAQTFDLVSAAQYDEDGAEFDIARVLNDDFQLDSAKLDAYSNLRMSPLFAFTYGTAFLTLTATLTHVFLYYRHSIYRQFKASRAEKEDIHTKMMRAYPEVPVSWYGGLFVTMLVAAIITCEVYPIKLPWWALLLALVIAVLLTLPIGIIQAISNNRIGLNVITELVCGYIYPGHPIPNVAFKVYGYMTMFQCLLLVEDMKLGHYMKIPPRKLFVVQLWGTIIGAVVNYAVFEWVLESKFNVLAGIEPDPTGQWDARNTKIFYAASIIWGALGPARSFGTGTPYGVLLWFFLIGLLLPLPFYLLHKRYPNGKWHLVNIPIFAIGTYAVPQSPANFILSGFIVSFVFQYLLYRRHHGWWKRYNYVLSAALDAGAQFSMLFVFVAFSNTPFPVWIGNAIPNTELCDLTLLHPAPNGAAAAGA